MKCSCPNCSSMILDDLAVIPGKGKNPKCPECGKRYWIHREPFVLRAYLVNGRRFCVQCGEDIGVSLLCPGCGASFPEYCVVQLKKLVRRKGTSSGVYLDFPWAGVREKLTPCNAVPTSTARSHASSQSKTPMALSLSPQVVKTIVALVVLTVLVGAVVWFSGRKGDRDFTQNYVFALYVLKAGSEQSQKMSTQLAGGTRLSEKELVELNKARTHIDNAMQKLNPPPSEFSASYERLQTLHNTYGKLYNLCSTSGPSPQVGDTARQLNEEFTQAANGVKNSLPPELADTLKSAIPKYRNLSFMVE